MQFNFEWDPGKAKANFTKHTISFEDATTVFKDKDAISVFDKEHSTHEDRWITMGLDLITRTVVVVHTYVLVNGDNCSIRIISARKATKREQAVYQEG